MKHFFRALKKITQQRRATYVNSEYILHKREKQSLFIGAALVLTPMVIVGGLFIVS